MARTRPVNSGYNIINGISTGSNQAYVDCWLEWKVLSQSISANTSTLRVLLYAACTKSSTTAWTVAEKYGYVGYDGENKQYRSTTYDFSNYAVNCFGDHTFTINHDSDGTKSLTLEGAWSTSHSTYISGGSASGTVSLTAIDRESTIRATDAAIGAASTVTVIRQNKSFTHSIAYRIGRLSGYLNSVGNPITVPEKMTAESISFELLESFYRQIPNNAYATVTLICRTYSGEKQIGQAQSCTFRATANPERCAPVITGTAKDINPVTLQLTGDENTLVRELSQLLCTITAVGQYGASIVEKRIAGVTVTEDTVTLDQPQSGSILFEATDSRGYTGQFTLELPLIPYIIPTIPKARLKRTDPTSGKALLTLAGKCYQGLIGETTNTVTACYSTLGGEPTPIELCIDGENYTAQAELTGLDYQQSHTLQVTVSDLLSSAGKTLTLGKGVPVFDWGENDFQFHVPVTGDFSGSFQGTYIRNVRVNGSNTVTLQSKMTEFTANSTARQSLFLFGFDNTRLVSGVVGLQGTGGSTWSGTDGVTVTPLTDGQFAVKLPVAAYDWFTLLSAEPFAIL